MMRNGYVSSKEAAEQLGVSLRTVQSLLARGLIACARTARAPARVRRGSIPISGGPDPGGPGPEEAARGCRATC